MPRVPGNPEPPANHFPTRAPLIRHTKQVFLARCQPPPRVLHESGVDWIVSATRCTCPVIQPCVDRQDSSLFIHREPHRRVAKPDIRPGLRETARCRQRASQQLAHQAEPDVEMFLPASADRWWSASGRLRFQPVCGVIWHPRLAIALACSTSDCLVPMSYCMGPIEAVDRPDGQFRHAVRTYRRSPGINGDDRRFHSPNRASARRRKSAHCVTLHRWPALSNRAFRQSRGQR